MIKAKELTMIYKIKLDETGAIKTASTYVEYIAKCRILDIAHIPYTPEIINDADIMIGEYLDERL
jgi:hypothetical protein